MREYYRHYVRLIKKKDICCLIDKTEISFQYSIEHKGFNPEIMMN